MGTPQHQRLDRHRPRHRFGVALLTAALMVAGCGKPAGNDTEKKPGEQNPARNGPPYEP